MAEKEFCPHCGQPVMKNKHCFSKALANLLLVTARRYNIYESFHLQKDLSLTKNQYANFQKLQYWGLAEKHYIVGRRVGGYWCLTKEAGEVLNGTSVPRWVETFNNKVVVISEDRVTLEQAIGYYDLPEAWARKQEKMAGVGQMDLFR